ncbi:alpha-crystallin domain-containing protein 22.3-like [Vitis riparia]|uniref:alpha-crystallin domain-containing protein 22.3-like n=1 Tax=Vitis riparia TaxID=96939 RepID=UPI00155AFB43|nr:alpha-crystallin domain-containing protein 22.3-like [Vitis riparia]
MIGSSQTKESSPTKESLISRVGGALHNVSVQRAECTGQQPPSRSCHDSYRKRHADDPPQRSHCMTSVSSGMTILPREGDTAAADRVEAAQIFLPSHPTMEELKNIVAATRGGFALTGSAAVGQIGPAIGHMDIGECEDSYLFRVSLPGVKRDEREFSCEVENDGKVSIRGVTTTGERTVYAGNQVFEMQTQNLCPSGHFSISFQLPGPVDPQQFSGNFGIDGILEGIVMKRDKR